ncbi:TonB-dependent receptor [Microbulbifer sp. THAF38]|uniref:TonB-dependent receptor n=1 Tax=Microbulbifer sp. THAF38 TaxID=2587856 RepID=UPI0012A79FCB|nr:TonB-dependent receptor [Microbulbifer sp. THAF38]QFT55702.1 Ferric enterobactin receptor precursor [Microbulbifer sp. THAF38]
MKAEDFQTECKQARGFKPSSIALAVAVASSISAPTIAQEQPEIEEVIITATARPVTKMESSISVSALDTEELSNYAPRSTAEVFRSLPGIRAESSGGGGNANITVRGIPLATGGSKYMQIHEDGLPVLEYGDINFGNTDNFIRADSSLSRIESVRGGSASTFASNSPGGVINMISKTGEEEGGNIDLSFGADYDETRLNFGYGHHLSDTLRFYVGGFLREGEGVRETGFNGDSGGQLKANLTKDFDNGYVRLYYKHLDDRVTTYLPGPVIYKGNGEFGTVANFDASSQTLHSDNYRNLSTFDAYGNPVNRDLSDGIESLVEAYGFESQFEFENGWTITDKFRISDVSGSFISPFTDTFGDYGPQSAQSMADQICVNAISGNGSAVDCSAGTSVTYANGGEVDELAYLNLLFDTEIHDLGLIVNDFKVDKLINDNIVVSAGFYYSKQNIKTSWNSWNALIQTVDGSDSQNLTITANANGDLLVDDGLWSASFLSYAWDLEYETYAPYMNVSFDVGDFTFDISARHDMVNAEGSLVSSCCGGDTDYDINGDGIISDVEDASASDAFGFTGGVITMANGNTQLVDYDADNTSFSLGGNYAINDSMAIFARYSEGGRAIADRLLQINGALNSDGSLSNTTDGFDSVDQLEIGYKFTAGDFDIFATYFNTITEETNAEITSGLTFIREYEAQGIELEGSYIYGDFSLNGNLTWTDAEISKDANNPSVVGNTPRRQADIIYTITPQYNWGDSLTFGASLQGSSEYYVSDSNQLKQDGYVLVNLFGSYYVTEDLTVSFNVNNLTDEFVVTEVEESYAEAGDIVRGRAISGRSTSVSFNYAF